MDLALMLARQNQLQEAVDQLNEALRLNPSSAEAHNNLGLFLLVDGKPEESLSHFTEALRLKPDLAAARDNITRAQMQIDARAR